MLLFGAVEKKVHLHKAEMWSLVEAACLDDVDKHAHDKGA